MMPARLVAVPPRDNSKGPRGEGRPRAGEEALSSALPPGVEVSKMSQHFFLALAFEFPRCGASFGKPLSPRALFPGPPFSRGCPENVSPITAPGLWGAHPSNAASQQPPPGQVTLHSRADRKQLDGFPFLQVQMPALSGPRTLESGPPNRAGSCPGEDRAFKGEQTGFEPLFDVSAVWWDSSRA